MELTRFSCHLLAISLDVAGLKRPARKWAESLKGMIELCVSCEAEQNRNTEGKQMQKDSMQAIKINQEWLYQRHVK